MDSASQFRESGKGRLLFEKVNSREIRKFLTRYRICSQHMDLSNDLVLGYVDSLADRMKQWNVGIVAPDLKPRRSR